MVHPRQAGGPSDRQTRLLQADQADRQVSQRSHDARAGAGPDTRAVLIECDVTDIMHPVLDRPMLANQMQQCGLIGLFVAEARDAEDDLTLAPAVPILTFPLEAEDLLDVRK